MVVPRVIRTVLQSLLLVAAGHTAPAGAGADAATAATSWRWSNVGRVVAFGDVHGAYDQLVALLQDTRVIDTRLSWVGGTTHLVSLGDLLDRGPESRRVLDLLMRIQQEAQQAGGAVHVVLGNHEVMNLTGDLRYVVPRDYAAFAPDETQQTRAAAFDRYRIAKAAGETQGAALRAFDDRYPAGYFARQAAFASSGTYGGWLATQPVVIVINDVAFLHGGLASAVENADVTELNLRVRAGLSEMMELEAQFVAAGYGADDVALLARRANVDATAAADAPAPLDEDLVELARLARRFTEISTSALFSDAGPLWYRGTAMCHGLLEQSVIERGLAALAVTRVVIGHTPTSDRRVQQRLGGKVIMLDTGMLQSHYHGHPAAMIIEADRMSVVYTDGESSTGIEDADNGGPRGWSRDALEQLLADAPISESRAVTRQGRAEFALQLQVARADEPTSPVPGTFLSATFVPGDKKQNAAELAAYRLDVLLDLNLVPVMASRVVDGVAGVVASAPARVITEEERRQQQQVRPNWCGQRNDYELMYVYDALIGNDRRSAADISYDGSNWGLRLTGHARAFPTTRTLPRESDNAVQGVVPKGLAQRLALLDIGQLQRALGSLLNKRQIEALLARRDQILATWQLAD